MTNSEFEKITAFSKENLHGTIIDKVKDIQLNVIGHRPGKDELLNFKIKFTDVENCEIHLVHEKKDKLFSNLSEDKKHGSIAFGEYNFWIMPED